ncbi:MAG: arylsulfatase [Candidatus Hydrogenedentes bacterium]|nr:arylsulfatase [Candidatus Hydrogenedentota bacterium]HOJ67476.1 arylsulfatase [Candidatus Hydrogenedentota bacterium]
MPAIGRRSFLNRVSGALAALAAGARSINSCASGGGKRPNIIFILADDLGYGDLGCYGQQLIQTPCLDRMAAEGLRFTQAYAGSTVCAPSRCALMTGMHMGHARVRGNADRQGNIVPLRPEDRTVAEVLRDAGYVTGLIGKWGLGDPGSTGVPNRKGFDEFYGFLNQVHAHNHYPDYLWRNETVEPIPENHLARPGVCDVCNTYAHDLFTREARDFITRHQREPFFLYLAYTLPHTNNERGADGLEVPSDAPYTDREWPDSLKRFAAMITRMDRDVGGILALLRELEIDRDTLVMFTSDNGPHKESGANPAFFNSSGGLRGIKRDLYEGGIRVPAIAWWPGKISPGSTSDHPWAFWDVLPTFAELAGTECPPCDGLSFAPLLRGATRPPERHPYFYWEFHERGFAQAVRWNQWKAVRVNLAEDFEIFDLNGDPAETTNIAASRPDLREEALRLFSESRVPSPLWPAPGDSPST